MDGSQFNPRFLAVILLPALILGGSLLFISYRASEAERDEALPPTIAPQPSRPRAAPEILDAHLATLQAEFPGYVLPMQRSRLAHQLRQAIESSDESLVMQLLDQGADTNWLGENRLSQSNTQAPLFLAIKRGNPAIVQALLEAGARVGGITGAEIVVCRNQWSQTPLYFAVRCGNRSIVELLLKHGAPIGASNGYGKTPIVAAIEEGDLGLFRYLASQGAVCDFEASFAKDRRPGASHALFRYPPEYFVPPFEDHCDQAKSSLIALAQMAGNNALLEEVLIQAESSPAYEPDLRAEIAVRLGDVVALRQLLDEGFDPQAFKPPIAASGNLIELAESLGQVKVVSVLSEFGLKRQTFNSEQRLLRTIGNGTVGELRAWITEGGKLDAIQGRARGLHGKAKPMSPLELAVQAQRKEIVDFLLQPSQVRQEWLAEPDLLLYALPYDRKDERTFSKEICRMLVTAGAIVELDKSPAADRDRSPFVLAAMAGWSDVCKSIQRLSRGPVNWDAALQAAAFRGHVETCDYLLKSGADPNYRDKTFGSTALEHALQQQNRKLFELLVQSGAEKSYPTQRDVSKGYNHFEQYAHPFYHSALVGNADFCEFLLGQFSHSAVWQPLLHEPYEYDNDIRFLAKGNTPLFAAVYGDHAETMKLLLAYALQKGDDGRPRVNINAMNQHGATALHEAIHFRAEKCVQLLLAAGANPTTQSESGSNYGIRETPLHLASKTPNYIQSRWPSVSRTFPLLAASALNGGNPNWMHVRNSVGMTPMHRHAQAGNQETCSKLIALGADPNTLTDDERSPLFSAIVGDGNSWGVSPEARQRRSQLCIMLVRSGAKFDRRIQLGEGRSTSYYALAFSHGLFDFCDALVERGVSPEVASHEGEYLCAAAKYKETDRLKDLISAGADINAQDPQDNTALHWAVLVRDIEGCRTLLRLGADPNIPGEDGRTSIFCVFDRFLNHVKQFNTPRPRETQQEAMELLRVLLHSKADPRIENEQHKTVLQRYSDMPPEFRELIKANMQSLNR